MNTPDQDIDHWIQLRKEKALSEEASPLLESNTLSKIHDLTQKKQQVRPSPSFLTSKAFLIPKPVTSSLCITIGLIKFLTILHLY